MCRELIDDGEAVLLYCTPSFHMECRWVHATLNKGSDASCPHYRRHLARDEIDMFARGTADDDHDDDDDDDDAIDVE